MIIFETVKSVLKITLKNWHLILILFIFKIISAFLFLQPLFESLSKAFSKNPLADIFFKQIDFFILSDFFVAFSDEIGIFIGTVLFGAIMVLVLNIFVNGMILGVMNFIYTGQIEKVFGVKLLVEYSFKNFYVLFKIFIISVIFYVGVFAVYNILKISALIPDSYVFYGFLIRVILTLLIFIFINFITDFAKVISIADNNSSSLLSFGKALTFIKNNFLTSFGIYIILTGFFVLSLVIYSIISKLIGNTPNLLFSVITLFVFQQLFVLFRAFFRIIFIGSELLIYLKLKDDKTMS